MVASQVTDNEERLRAGLCQVLEPAGLTTLIAISDGLGRGLSAQVVRLLTHSRPTGVVIMGGLQPSDRAHLIGLVHELEMPTVVISDSVPGLPSVRCDNVAAMRAVVEHLTDAGCRRIAFLRGPWHDSDAGEREHGFRRALAATGRTIDERLFLPGEYAHEPSYHAVRYLLAAHPDLDAVVAANDRSAAGALAAALDSGLSVPARLKITGFDDARAGDESLPALTTYDPGHLRQGAEAARLLLAGVRGRFGTHTVLVSGRLVPRGTTQPRALDVEAFSRRVHVELAARDRILGLNRALMRCQSEQEVVDELASRLDRFGIRDLALVLVDRSDPDSVGRRDHGVDATLALLVRGGHRLATPEQPFASHRLLPPAAEQHRQAFVAVQPLVAADQEVGYVLLGLPLGHGGVAEMLALDVARSIAGVRSRVRVARHAARLEDLVAQRTRELQRANESLRLANAGLQRSLLIDELTSIANRRAFHQHLEHHWKVMSTQGGEMSLLMIDVDLFKAFNDRYGHMAGDDTLRAIAECLRESLHGPEDLASRYGGEEFAVVLPAAGLEVAEAVARRFTTRLAERRISHEASSVAPIVTASIGIAAARPDPTVSPERLVAAADAALYEAKTTGRNRREVRHLEPPDPVLV
jgi:diguanylate cyclase (GGDEF)-like protein